MDNQRTRGRAIEAKACHVTNPMGINGMKDEQAIVSDINGT
jgi:hypothetical protein